MGEFELMLIMIGVGVVFWAIYIPYLKITRVSRLERKFQEKRQLIAKKAEEQRLKAAKESILSDVRPLSSMVTNELNRYRRELPPRVYDEVKVVIDKFVGELQFDTLYSFYSILLNTNDNQVLQDVNQFLVEQRVRQVRLGGKV